MFLYSFISQFTNNLIENHTCSICGFKIASIANKLDWVDFTCGDYVIELDFIEEKSYIHHLLDKSYKLNTLIYLDFSIPESLLQQIENYILLS